MAKLYTPAMAKIDKKKAKLKGKVQKSSPGREAWKRLIRNKLAVAGMIIIVILILVAIFANVIAPEGIDDQVLRNRFQPPSSSHIMGTDQYGRDIFSRIVYGARISLPIGFICTVLAFAFGGVLGSVAAYNGGKVDNVIMRIMDIFQSIPPLLMAIAIAASLGNGILNLVLAISLSTTPARSRVIRAAILTVKRNDYIESARAIGASSRRQLLRYMLPNALGPIMTAFTFSVATAILTVSSMAYIGLGIVAPTPEWGSMLSSSKEFMRTAAYTLYFPGIMIMITVLALNLFGDGLRDALDPRLK